MKVLQPVPVRVLASRIIPSVDPGLAAAFKLEPRHRALALFTSDSDDVSYIAIDEATKKAAVDVVYASKDSYKFAGIGPGGMGRPAIKGAGVDDIHSGLFSRFVDGYVAHIIAVGGKQGMSKRGCASPWITPRTAFRS